MYDAGYGPPYYPDGWSQADEDAINGRVPLGMRQQVKDDYESEIEELKEEIESLQDRLGELQAQYDNFLEVNYDYA